MSSGSISSVSSIYCLRRTGGKDSAVLSDFSPRFCFCCAFGQFICEPRIVDAIRKKRRKRITGVFLGLGASLSASDHRSAIMAVTLDSDHSRPPIAPHFSFMRSALSQGCAFAHRSSLTKAENVFDRQRPRTDGAADVKSIW